MNLRKLLDSRKTIGLDYRELPPNVMGLLLSISSDKTRGFDASAMSDIDISSTGITFTIPGEEFEDQLP